MKFAKIECRGLTGNVSRYPEWYKLIGPNHPISIEDRANEKLANLDPAKTFFVHQGMIILATDRVKIIEECETDGAYPDDGKEQAELEFGVKRDELRRKLATIALANGFVLTRNIGHPVYYERMMDDAKGIPTVFHMYVDGAEGICIGRPWYGKKFTEEAAFSEAFAKVIAGRQESPASNSVANGLSSVSVCSKCDGRGYLQQYAHVEGGRCYACSGTGRYVPKGRKNSK